MNLEDAVADLEAKFTVHPEIGNYAWGATREPYVAICSGGLKDEGVPLPALCSSPDLAVRLWHWAVMTYAANKSGVIYWRARPEIEEIPPLTQYDTGRYVVYSRLVISDHPQICEQVLPPNGKV